MKRQVAREPRFKFHWGCKELKLTHLCFADDLLVVSNGDVDSATTIKKALEEFSGISGLIPNVGKSTLFFGSVKQEIQNQIKSIMGFNIGTLPVRYLGVPLVSKKIGIKECKPLIDKVKSRIIDWKNKSLSFAGRLQLISAVLASMQVYWMAVFKIPAGVIQDLEKLFKGFLWNRSEIVGGKAKVAWQEVCKPKDQGALV